MVDIATLGLTLCLAAGNIECDNISYEFDSQLRKDGVNGITLLYTKSQRQVIKVSSEYKKDKYVTTAILIHELAHVKVTQDGHSHDVNRRHLQVYKNTCKQILNNLKSTNNKICRTKVNWG